MCTRIIPCTCAESCPPVKFAYTARPFANNTHKCWNAADRPVNEGQFPQLRMAESEKKTEQARGREGEKGRKRKSEIYCYTFISRCFLLWLLFKGGAGNWNTFAHWHISLWPFLRAGAQKENPLTLAGLLQILVGLSCKAGRHTESAGFNTVPLVCTLSSVPPANALLPDILASSCTLAFLLLKLFLTPDLKAYSIQLISCFVEEHLLQTSQLCPKM